MDRQNKFVLTSLLCFVGALVMLALTVYPFQYGLFASAVVVVGIVAFGVFDLVLDEAGLGAS